jgi:transposase
MKSEFLQRVLPLRNNTKQYELEHLANERGHQVIWLPPYHSQYNPVELVWAQVKREE